jgi:hypothetical protein
MAKALKVLSIVLILGILLSFNIPSAKSVVFTDCVTDGGAGVSVAECQALVDLYNSTGGASWMNKTGWLSSTNVDDWFGVALDGSNHVDSLSINSNNLVGTIPSSIGSLTYLRDLSLYNNELDGTIPAGISLMTGLNTINLSNNHLDNPIPDSIGSLTNLITLDLSANQFTGEFPTFILTMTALQSLSLGNNGFNGPIPIQISNLTGLSYLYLSANEFTGNIPSELSLLTSMKYLYLAENQLTGSIPAELFSLPSIKDLVLHKNQLSGPIPDALGDAVSLQRLFLHEQHLTGNFPVDIGDLQNLQQLWINGNDLYGPIPESFADLNLGSLIIGGNGFWSTDTDVIAYLDTFDANWETFQGSQGLLPTEGDDVGWGDLNESEGAFLPVFQFNKQFNNDGTAAPAYLVEVKDVPTGDWILQAEVDGTDTSICPASTAADAPVICEYRPQLSDFVRPPVTGEHYWKISHAFEMDGGVWNWINVDGAKTFTIAEPPVVNYPTNQTTKVNPTFKWAPVEGAERYNLVVLDSISHKTLDHSFANDYCDISMCVYALPTTELNLANDSYTWMVRADMGDGDYTDWGDATFTKVAAPTTKQPSVVNTMPNPKIIWTPVAGQTRYQIQLYTSGGVKKLDKTFDTSVCGATTCTYAPTTAILNLANGAYKWKVRAGDAVEWGTYSAFKTFNKVSPPAGVSPTGTITATNPTFKWKKITGVNKYFLELRKSSGALVKSAVIISPTCTTTTCSYTFAPALNLAKGDYKWRVKAYHGYYGPYGAYMTFKKQ